MRITLCRDTSIDIQLGVLARSLTRNTELNARSIDQPLDLGFDMIQFPDSYAHLPAALVEAAEQSDLTVIATRVPYDNNYFYEYSDKVVILSFYAWEQLTSLSVENGLIYFLAAFLFDVLPVDASHHESMGCINDFMWDKTDVDAGMRSGAVCQTCEEAVRKRKLSPMQRAAYSSLKSLLKDLASSSSRDANILEFWKQEGEAGEQTQNVTFDVFICYNSEEKPEVKAISDKLTSRGVKTWRDEEQLRPGLPWQLALEEQIDSIASAAVFVGQSGVGPWLNFEILSFLSEFVRRGCPVIPVILDTATEVPKLPIFLRQMTWVDFRSGQEDCLSRLIWGITGKRPQ